MSANFSYSKQTNNYLYIQRNTIGYLSQFYIFVIPILVFSILIPVIDLSRWLILLICQFFRALRGDINRLFTIILLLLLSQKLEER